MDLLLEQRKSKTVFGLLLVSLAVLLAAVVAFRVHSQEVISPSLELSSPTHPDLIFPALIECRLVPDLTEDCPTHHYTTFQLTYTVGSDTPFLAVPTLRVRLKTAFAYKYNGQYRKEHRYVRYASWPDLQINNGKAPNFVSVKIEGNGEIPTSPDITPRGDGKLDISFTNEVIPGAKIIITYGDTRFGSPGYIIPNVPYEIDLVVEEDTLGNRRFVLVDAEMPTLRISGDTLDNFVVTAPSTPRENTFEILVKAMEGYDAPTGNMYIVQKYAGTITFSSTDRKAVLPSDYTFVPADRGVRKFAVTLPSGGTHTINVKETGSSIAATSNPIIIDKKSDKTIFWGTLHQHTFIGGHGAQTPEFAFDYAKNKSGLDFLAVTDHCRTDKYDWFHSRQIAEDYNEPGTFVTFGAYEWTAAEFGHRHVLYLDPLKEANYCEEHRVAFNPTTILTPTLEQLFEAVDKRDALLVVHHPAWFIPNPNLPKQAMVWGDIANINQKLVEIYSHHGSSEKYDNAPYIIHNDLSQQRGPEEKAFVQDAIAMGYKLGITADGDDHNSMPGSNFGFDSPRDSEAEEGFGMHYSRLGITGVYADELTREGLWEALNARRTYGTTGARIILDFAINHHMMGEEFTTAQPPIIRVNVIGTDIIDTISVIKDGYTTFYEHKPNSKEAEFTVVDSGVGTGEEHSYYIRVHQKDDHFAWSSPIWVTRVEGVEGEPASDTGKERVR